MQKKMQRGFTKSTYDKAAQDYVKKFKDIGVRVADVDKAFSLIEKENPNVLEISCGGGREAEYILTKTDKYAGMDISEGMLEIARENVPDAYFVKVDISSYQFPENLDIVFTFASLLHSSKEEVSIVFKKLYDVLNDNGVVYVSLKRKDEYT